MTQRLRREEIRSKLRLQRRLVEMANRPSQTLDPERLMEEAWKVNGELRKKIRKLPTDILAYELGEEQVYKLAGL